MFVHVWLPHGMLGGPMGSFRALAYVRTPVMMSSKFIWIFGVYRMLDRACQMELSTSAFTGDLTLILVQKQ
jgi:hypothetical protein